MRTSLFACILLSSTFLLGQDSNSLVSPILPMSQPPRLDKSFKWRAAFNESMRFTLLQHGLRLAFQPGTRARLGGPFFNVLWSVSGFNQGLG